MKITLLGDDALRLEDNAGPLTIEAESVSQAYGPFAMLASGLAVCTHGVLRSWASQARLAADDLRIDVAWTFAEEPHRVASFRLAIEWPSLPEKRRTAAARAAAQCAVHHTFATPPRIEVEVTGAAAAAAAPARVVEAPAPPPG